MTMKRANSKGPNSRADMVPPRTRRLLRADDPSTARTSLHAGALPEPSPVLGRALSSLCMLLLIGACTAETSEPGTTGGSGGSGGGAGDGLSLDDGDTTVSVGDGDTDGTRAPECGSTQSKAELTTEPVDIILVLDNSGSMQDELDAVEQNINVNFANILEDSGVDYRVILISRHRIEARSASEEASTSICVSSPLSGLESCPSPIPVLSSRFFHYSIKIESTDSFDRILETYNLPDDKYDVTLVGWSEWLRPDAKKVFLELTDDNEDMTVDAFVEDLTTLAPEHFGSPEDLDFIFHSIIGLAEKATPTAPYLPDEPIETGQCTGNSNDVENAGETYQELSKRTGGLRFPLCQFDAYDVVFQTIAEDVVTQADVACDFEIPEPPASQTLELDKVAVSHTTDSGTTQFGQAATQADCQDDAFYIQNDRIWLCPSTCESVRANTTSDSSVDVIYTCESTIIVK